VTERKKEMSEKIKTVRMGKGANFTEQELDTSDLLAVVFTGSDGHEISVMIQRGVVNVHTTQGRLIVKPEAANGINVIVEPL
jgi:hypothetical protein